MAAFKPGSGKIITPEKPPKTVEDFREIFDAEVIEQSTRIVYDSIRSVTRSRSYFKEKDIMRAVLRCSETELDEKYLGHRDFRLMMETLFRQIPMVTLDQDWSPTMTTPHISETERMMLAMAGELTDAHVLDMGIVEAALSARTMVAKKSLPQDLIRLVESRHRNDPKAEFTLEEVLGAARSQGMDVRAVGMEWNRPAATSLPDDVCIDEAAFMAELEAKRESGEPMFTQPTVVVIEELSPAAAQALLGVVQSSAVPVQVIKRFGISAEQTTALLTATVSEKRVSVIEGTAGAGKSFTMKGVCQAYTESGYYVMGAALSWTAAKVLGGATGLPDKSCRAMEGLLRSMRKASDSGTEFFQGPTLIIVDEAGMVGTQHMHDLLLLTRQSRYPIKIVLTGDSLQVVPVDAGNALEAIVETHGTTRIDTIRRQKQESHRIAVKRFSARRSGEALYPFVQQECMQWCKDEAQRFTRVVRDFVSYRTAYPDRRALVLALTNKAVVELNKQIRAVYKKLGLIEAAEVQLDVTDGRETWQAGYSIGDEVVLRANDQNLLVYRIPRPEDDNVLDETDWSFKGQGVFNRNAGRIVGIRRSSDPAGSYDFIINLEGDDPGRVIVNSQKFVHGDRPGMPMVHNFATTIYASQGQTVQKVFMLDSDRADFRLAYVGMSRHTDSVDLYLNETELHLRLDKMLGKSPSKPLGATDPNDIGVELGRYRRSEMLQAVSLAMGKDSQNLTATIFEMRKRLGRQKQNSPEDMARIRQGDPADPVIDFVPALNVTIPLVDMARILELPDPVGESEFVRPSDVEKNRQATPMGISPVHLRHDPSLPDLKPREEEHESLFSRVRGWLGNSHHPEHPEPAQARATLSRHASPISPFDVDEADVIHAKAPPKSWLKRVGEVLEEVALPRPAAKVEIPLLPLRPSIGEIGEDGVLKFSHVPQTKVPEGVSIGTPSDAHLKACRGVWWDVGRGGEPRILARSHTGAITARYRLDGKCVVGEGYPPVSFTPKASPDNPIYIVPGAREWFLMQEYNRQKYADDPTKAPHLIWAAKDVDWGHVAKSMTNKKVVIVRSRHDDNQMPWAKALQDELFSRWRVRAAITPPLPEVILAPAPPAPGASRTPRP